MAMLKAAILMLALLAQTLDPPIIDNDRVNVRERPTIGGPAGSIVRKTDNEIWISETPAKAVVITLKDKRVAPLENGSGYPPPFPREGSTKVYEDARVIVWDATWTRGRPTPMHFHDKDAILIALSRGTTQSTTPDGKVTTTKWAPGMVTFNLRNRIHTEALIDGEMRAIITELK